MFLLFPSNFIFKKSNSRAAKQLIGSAKAIFLLGTILPLMSFYAQADHQVCTSVAIPSYDPSGSWDELTGTMTVKVTQTTKYIDVCYTVPDIQTPPIGQGDNGGGGVPERPKMPRPPYCDTLNSDLLSCKRRAEKTYQDATASCSAEAVGGAAVGVGAGFGTQVEKFGKWGRIASGVVAVVGAASSAWGASGCTSGPANSRDNALLDCDSDFNNKSNTCSQFN